jgi:hypothetical protein
MKRLRETSVQHVSAYEHIGVAGSVKWQDMNWNPGTNEMESSSYTIIQSCDPSVTWRCDLPDGCNINASLTSITLLVV